MTSQCSAAPTSWASTWCLDCPLLPLQVLDALLALHRSPLPGVIEPPAKVLVIRPRCRDARFEAGNGPVSMLTATLWQVRTRLGYGAGTLIAAPLDAFERHDRPA